MADNIYLESVLKPWSSLNQVTSIDKLDMIRKVKLFPSSFIVNTKDFPEYGHWIVIIFTSPTHSIFFDSLALPMIKQKNEISAFIKKNSETYEYNLIPIQSTFSHYCGFFCIAKIISHMLGEHHDNFINHFSVDLPHNDFIVIKLIKSFTMNLL